MVAKVLIAATLQVKTHIETMDRNQPPKLAAQIAGAINWWHGAGVDCDFVDEPFDWLGDEGENGSSSTNAVAEPAHPLKPEKSADVASIPTATLGGEKATWPAELGGFKDWWLAEKSLDENGTYPRIAPRGTQGAELMVLVAEPEIDDREVLLSGPQGSILSAMLDAMGIAQDAVYIAAALPRHTPLADWAQLQAAGMGDITLHHIKLVQPKRLLVFGSSILPLLGHGKAQSPAAMREISHESGRIPAMAARDIAMLLQSAGARTRFWERWLEWTSEQR